ncbi:MAG: DNA polymerase III subunit alpha, partial [Patescibacteria group bacterium]|nr:DNA polymerase III subunit alpha [Patescibacteria group bacterium]
MKKIKPNFVHLHVHSHYSILDGLTKIDDLIQKVKDLKQPAVALTDHGVMHGAFEFYNKAKAAGVKPLVGCEVYLAPNSMDGKTREDTNAYHLVLLAKNHTGYRNLMHLATRAHLEGYYYKPRIDKELLSKYSEGLIALSACLQGEIPRLILANRPKALQKAINFYKDIFKDDFYLEVQHHPNLEEQAKVNAAIFQLAQKENLKVVATQDSHYLNIEDQEAHEALLCVQTGTFVTDTNRMSMADDHFHLTSAEEMAQAFSDHPEVLTNTLEVAEKIDLEIPASEKLLLPKFPIPKHYNPETYLEELAKRGLNWRYGGKAREEALDNPSTPIKVGKEIIERMKYELSVVNQTGYASYYLIVSDFCNWAKDHDISVGPGRGSGAGSLLAYLVGITDIDPLEYGLIFERFLNPERISPPDFDIDLADDRRDEVIQYVREKYGVDKVAQICTFGKMESKQAVRDVARVLGYSYIDGDRIAKIIPLGFKLDKALAESRELQEMYEREEKVQKIIDLAKRLEGVVRQVGIHAAGVVIAPEIITHFVPLQKAPKGDLSIITQYSMGDIEKLGLVKMDFLGLSNLTIIQQALKVIEKLNETEVDIENLPLDDKKTYELFAAGNTVGVFQFSSDGMRRYLRELQPTIFEDLVAMVALYRPGPMDSIPDFIAGKHGRREITYLDPRLKPILDKTYGVIVTQDQVLEIARSFAGFSYGEADILRKAVGKKIHKLLIEQKKKFIQGAIKNGASKDVAVKVWDFIEPFASYGFNKAHAAGYAMIAYITGYLKANYPSEFMSALLTSDQTDLDKVARDIGECEQLGIRVLPPDVNKSFVEFGVDKKTGDISFALAAIKNIGVTPAKIIIEERKKQGEFKSLEDFLKRLAPSLNKKIMESLAKCGALDQFGERQQLLNNMDNILKFAQALAKKGLGNQA